MTLRIGLIGDPHARLAPVADALALFARLGVSRIFCLGDIAGYGDELEATWDCLQQAGCESILGNHELWYLQKHQDQNDPLARGFAALPRVRDLTLAGKRVYLVHASPPRSVRDGIRLLDEAGNVIPQQQSYWAERLQDFEADVLIVGHTHQVFATQLGKPLVINPGSSGFNHSCAVLTLPEMHCEFHALGGRPLRRSWNWGMMTGPDETGAEQ